METTSPYLFVYGTLLQPANEFARYLNAHCKLVSTGKIKGRLYDIGEYPGAVADNSADTYIYGSIFLMDDIARVLPVLDDYEGIGTNEPLPHEYLRQLCAVETDDAPITCWVYLYNWPVNRHQQIMAGNYSDYILNRST